MGPSGRTSAPLALALLLAPLLAPVAALAGNCEVDQRRDVLPFLANIMPEDSPVDVWCRLHASLKPGQYKGVIAFSAAKRKVLEGDYKAERPFNVSVPPLKGDAGTQVAAMLQSLLPTRKDDPAKGPDGQPFGMALEWAVQGTAPTTPAVPASEGLGLPPAFPGAKGFALWMPVQLRLSPINMFGADFQVAVVFRPRVARLIESLEGRSQRLTLSGASSKVLPYAGTNGCPAERAPDCAGLPETIDLATAWTVDAVTLTSVSDGGLSETTRKLAAWLRQGPTKPSVDTFERDFTVTEGKGKLQIQTKTREVNLVANGDPNKASGTRSIVVTWRERPRVKGTYASWLEDAAQRMRDEIVVKYGGGPTTAAKAAATR